MKTSELGGYMTCTSWGGAGSVLYTLIVRDELFIFAHPPTIPLWHRPGDVLAFALRPSQSSRGMGNMTPDLAEHFYNAGDGIKQILSNMAQTTAHRRGNVFQ
jgi:hypothetical protein